MNSNRHLEIAKIDWRLIMGYDLRLQIPRRMLVELISWGTRKGKLQYLPKAFLHRLAFVVNLSIGSIMTFSHVLVVCLHIVIFLSRLTLRMYLRLWAAAGLTRT